MMLVFDTNVFLQSDVNRWELIERFPTPSSPPEFLVAVDDGGLIEDEYLEQAIVADPESPIRIATERILDGTGFFVVRKSSTISGELSKRLHKYSCTKPIEPQLFGVAHSTRDSILVCANDPDTLPILREYMKPGVLNQIQHGGVGPVVSSLKETLKIIRMPRERSPETLDELHSFLSKQSLGPLKNEEREFIEFKNPEVDYLSQELLQKTVRAVCGMLNSRDGWVFIGIDDHTGKIDPFPPRYKNRSRPLSLDGLSKNILEEIDRICPQPGKLVNTWPIPDDRKQNYVFVIHVQQGTQDYLYRDKNGKLNKTKWIRSGPRTIPDPTWHGHP